MDFTAVLKVIAPWLASAIGGPLGALAVTAASNALGLTDQTTDTLKQAISGATPEQLLALKEADQKFALEMQALGFKNLADLEGIAAGDRANARSMNMARPSFVPASLSLIVTVGFLGLLTGMMMGYLKANDNQAMLIMLGALGVAFGQVTNFWLGSTMSSQIKDRTIANAIK